MAFYSSKDVAYVFVGEDTWQARLSAVGMKIEATLSDTTPLGAVWRQMTDTGLRRGELTFSGFYDGDKPGMNTVSGSDKVVSVLLEGNTPSLRFYGFERATVSAAEIGVSADSVHTSSPEMIVRGAVGHGFVVAPLTARTTGGTTKANYADMLASSTTARAYLHVTDIILGGYTNLIVTVQSCATAGGSYDDETAFSAVTAPGAQSIALAGTVERYLDVKWAWTGSGSGQSATFFVGVVP